MTERSIALFDIDNTLVRGFSVFHFADFLQTKELFPSHIRQIMQNDYEALDQGRWDYRRFATEVVNHFYIGLEGVSESEVITAGKDFLPLYRLHLLPYSDHLVAMMNSVGLTIVISGAPKEAFRPLGKSLGIEVSKSYLLEGGVINGIYTGKTKLNMALDNEKRRAVMALTEEFDFGRSFAFGDSIHDLPLLEVVENPFVVMRDIELMNYATDKGWTKVDENNILAVVSERLTKLGLIQA